MFRLGENVLHTQVTNPAAQTSTVTSTGLDTKGYDGALLLILLGAVSGTTPTLDVKLQESDDNSAWSDITGATLPQIAAAGANKAYSLDVRLGGRANRKRYLRYVGTIAGTTPSFTMGADLMLYEPNSQPVTNSPVAVIV